MRPDIEKTRAYYQNAASERVCNCVYCRNYCARVKAAYPQVARYLASLGVDVEKPFEVFLPEPDGDGGLEYPICQYVIFGTCPEDYFHQSGGVTFRRSDCHPSTKIDEEHFVLDVYPIKLSFEETEREVMQG